MKKTILVVLVLAFFSCSTDNELIVQEETNTNQETFVEKSNYRDDQWGSMNIYDPINREAVKVWVKYGDYNTLRRQGSSGMKVYKVPNRPVYLVGARINNGASDGTPFPNTGGDDPLPFAQCNYFNDLANSSSPWALKFKAGDISLEEVLIQEQLSQEAEAYATGQGTFFVICYNGVVVGFVSVILDDTGLVSNPGGVANEPGELSGSWSPAE